MKTKTKYTPKVSGNFVEVMLRGEPCEICHKVMLPEVIGGIDLEDIEMYDVLFDDGENDQKSQMRRAGIPSPSTVIQVRETSIHPVCKECEQAGLLKFKCFQCNTVLTSDRLHHKHLDLCKSCEEQRENERKIRLEKYEAAKRLYDAECEAAAIKEAIEQEQWEEVPDSCRRIL